MPNYVLRSLDENAKPVSEATFECLSIAGALDRAQKLVRGHHADLYQDGQPVCSMELVTETGVWLVGGPRRGCSESTLDEKAVA